MNIKWINFNGGKARFFCLLISISMQLLFKTVMFTFSDNLRFNLSNNFCQFLLSLRNDMR